MPLYLKILIVVLYVTYRYRKYGCTQGLLKPLCHKKHKQLTKTSNLGNTPAPSEFISDESKLTSRTRHPPRSSVIIQEMELQPMIPTVPTVQRTPVTKAADMNERLTRKDAVRATPNNVAKALESAVRLNFDQYYEKRQLRAKRRGIPPTP